MEPVSESRSSPSRVTVDGKFFRCGAEKFFARGLTYGPFAPNANGELFPEPAQARRDLAQIRSLGANLLRLYYVPPRWFLDLAAEAGLKLLIDIPWPKHVCFFETYAVQVEARRAVRAAASECRGHPAVFAYSVVNEIPAEIVRWSGPRRVARFIEKLIAEAKSADPETLCTFASFPPTEFLVVRNADFLCFNVYLEQTDAFEAYLARLQSLAEVKPLVLGEFGLDGLRHGEARKSELLRNQVEAACRTGLAGLVLFSYTDDWYRGGEQIAGWEFGLTTRERQPKASFGCVQQLYQRAPHFPLPRTPRVSVVVASYNGGRTLETCLSSLERLNYPDYEVILVDDGSNDNTQEIAARRPCIRNVRQTNQGLSAARNAGIAAATGEIVAFTDSDCRPDEDWLYYLIGDMLRGGFVGIGGHNFLPPEDSPVAAAVMVSPGGPAHVMLSDQEAEHIPGCNMAFYKWALEEIKGFDPVYRKAGDDVDVCWRLRERGYKLGFSPAGFVWHYRRSTVKAYLKQQAGYGEAEALLASKHPEYFNALGGSIWRGHIYSSSRMGLLVQSSVIYHGIFGSGFFQKLYQPAPAHALMLCTSLPYHVLINLPLLALAIYSPFLAVPAFISVLGSLAVCGAAAVQAELPRDKTRWWSRALVACLFFLQPLVRGWIRYTTPLHLRLARPASAPAPARLFPAGSGALEPARQLCFSTRAGVDRFEFLREIIGKLDAERCLVRLDSGWEKHDLEVFHSRWTRMEITTVNEFLARGETFLRCRLEVGWSMLAKILFLVTLAGTLLLIEQAREAQPWVWMGLLLVPLVIWFVEDERRDQGQLAAGVIQEAARELKLRPVGDLARAGGAESAGPVSSEDPARLSGEADRAVLVE